MENKKLWTWSDESKRKLSEKLKGRVPHNKGKKQTTKYYNYTNGTKNIKLKEGDCPPDGFYRGQVRRPKTEEEKKQWQEKREKTMVEKYGSTSYNNQEKMKETCLERYGAENYAQTPEYLQKKVQTCLEKYGTESPMQTEEVKQKLKETFLDKYGVENISQCKTNAEKISQTWQNKPKEEVEYSVEKRINTNKEKYGIDYRKKFAEKMSLTCQEKYGVAYYCMTTACRTSSGSNSKPNLQFEELLKQNNIPYEREFPLESKSYDFKIGNKLIEINPTITHNTHLEIYGRTPMGAEYHKEKSFLAQKYGYRCIHVWEWDDLQKIINLLKPRVTVYGRKCTIKEISLKEANDFLNEYHLQGAVKATTCIGLYYDEILVSVMTFGIPRYNKKYQYELLRYASMYKVLGGAEKLFKYFIDKYQPNSIISYCDFSKFNGDTYSKLGFKQKRVSLGKHWSIPNTSHHIADNLLRTYGFDKLLGNIYGTFGKNSSNTNLMLTKTKYLPVYDAGQITFTWNK